MSLPSMHAICEIMYTTNIHRLPSYCFKVFFVDDVAVVCKCLNRSYGCFAYNLIDSERTLKLRSHLAQYVFQLFTIELNSTIANDLKPIGMMKMQYVTIYPNIYECASDS